LVAPLRRAGAVTASASHEAATVVRVRIPSPLRSYTGRAEVAVAVPVLAPELPPTISGVLAALDGAYPGIRFRIIDEQRQLRPHVKLFVGNRLTRDLASAVANDTELMIVAALSGG
jgi:molybdopterin converting factor small subunit